MRKPLLEGIERIATAAAIGARGPEPVFKVNPDEHTPATITDSPLTRRTSTLFQELLGREHVIASPPTMGGEDFGRYGREGVPIFLFFLGTQSPERIAEAKRQEGRPMPSLHSDLFYPIPEPTIKTGVLAMSMAVLDLLSK